MHFSLFQFCQSSSNEDEELAHKVLGDEYAVQIATLRELMTRIVSFPNIQKWLTPEGFTKIFVILGRNSQGVGTSAFATYVSNVEKLNVSEDEKKAVLDTIDHIYEVMDSGKVPSVTCISSVQFLTNNNCFDFVCSCWTFHG